MNYKIQCLGTRNQALCSYINADLSESCIAEKIDSVKDISSNADICLVSGVYYKIKSEYLNKPRLGVWGFHETKLPIGKGFAPVQWTILNKEDTLWISFFKLTDKIDSGPLLGQECCKIDKTDFLPRAKSFILIRLLIKKYLLNFLDGKIQPYNQSGSETHYRKRTPEDSRLDMQKSLIELWDLIRVCDYDKYPAWFKLNGKKFKLKVEHYED